MKLTRVQRVLAMVVAVLVIAASSQAAVCELACRVGIQEMGCHAAASASMAGDDGAAMTGMSDGHCAHRLAVAATQVSVQACQDGRCSHASVPVLAKAGTSAGAQFAAVQWVTIGVVPVQLTPAFGAVGLGMRAALTPAGTDPLVMSLRV